MAAEKDITEVVRERYGNAAQQVMKGSLAGCCSPACCSGGQELMFGLGNYDSSQVQNLPTLAASASLGCGNPVAYANLAEGETVLDLGSGGGIDCLLSAERVGPSGHVYGLDMTDEMLSLARANLKQTSLTNVTFVKGQLDAIPLPDESVDVVISNCVVNLAPDKERVIREIFRVLRPGGRIAIADVVATRPLPEEVRQDQAAWAG